MNHTTHEDTVMQTAVRRPGKPFSAGLWSLAALALALAASQLQAQQFTPPPPPAVAPLIGQTYATDKDKDRVDDELKDQAIDANFALALAPSASQAQEAQATLANKVNVELIFKAPVTQAQINAFLAAGGEITYMYKAVSYGWNGRVPLQNIDALPALLGGQLVLVSKPKLAEATLDKATRCGRVRPMWASGFAGNSAGFDGDNSITIGVLDTGVDASHTDLAGRQVYWHDFVDDYGTDPTDWNGHGSHVAGIALGSGAVGGSGTSTLYFSQNGYFDWANHNYTAPLELPATSCVFSTTAEWIVGQMRVTAVGHPQGVYGEWEPASGMQYMGDSAISASFPLSGGSSTLFSLDYFSEGGAEDYWMVNSVTNYPSPGDGFNKFRGVAPGCRWAGGRVLDGDGFGYTDWINAGIDDMVLHRVENNIKVMNLSLGCGGDPGLDPSMRQKINTAVNNGIVVAIAAGNDGAQGTTGQYQVDDPGRAALALTVAASDDNNQVTYYTSVGFPNPGSVTGQEEDYKPDLMAPGGSKAYYTGIMSVDSNWSDGWRFGDQQANDYTQMNGTSMATPFVAGCAALVIDAMQQKGISWNFASSAHPLYVKMLLSATASESNAPREDNNTNPTLQRAAAGPSGFPAGKDYSEGYGMINPDAAVEAVSQSYTVGSSASCALGSGFADKRVWARSIQLNSGDPIKPSLTVPSTGDFDMYLYSATPGTYGAPVILASSTNAGNGTAESFTYTPSATQTGILVVKRVSGSGTFTLSSAYVPTVQFSQSASNGSEGLASVSVTVTLSRSCSVPVSVNYSLSGTATNGVDYTGTAGTLTFSAGQVSRTISITVNNDSVYEPNETVAFILSSPSSNALLGTPRVHVYTINEDDRPPNDQPVNAQELKPMRDYSNTAWVSGQPLRNAQTSSYTPSCAGAQWPDVWYSVSLFPGMKLTVTNSSSPQSCVALYTDNAGTLQQQACSLHNAGAPPNSVTYQATSGVYKVWVQVSAPDTNSNVSLAFLLHQDGNEAGTTKDVCAYAEMLYCGSGSIVGPLTVGATAGPGQPNGLSVPDVWYRIYPSNGQPGLTISFDDQGSYATPGFVAVYRGECGQLLLRNCTTTRDAQGNFSIIGLKAGQNDPLYIRIGSASTLTNQWLQVSCFDKTNP